MALVIILTISLFLTLALGFHVLVSAPHLTVNRTFAAFIGMMILWIIKDLVLWGFNDRNTGAGWWACGSFLIGLGLLLVFLLFTDVFPENGRPNWRRLSWYGVPGLLLIPLIINGRLWNRAGFVDGRFEIDLNGYAQIFGFYNYLILGTGISQLVRKYRRYRETAWRQQISSVIVSVGLTATLLVLSNNLLPLIGIYSLLPFSSIFILLGAMIYVYAITNFNLFSLQSALGQLRVFPLTSKVAIAVAGTGLIGFLVVQVPIAIWTLGDGVSGWAKFVVFSMIGGTIPSLALVLVIVRILSRPLRELTEMALDVSHGNYGAETGIASNDELGVLASSFNTMSRKMAVDIARLKEINQAMISAEKLAMAGALATSVAHEVNNPLASISSLVQSLLGRESEERNRETLRLILGQITRISAVLRDLMDFARPKPPEPRPTEINQIIHKSLELALYDKRFRTLRVERLLDPTIPLLHLDSDRMQQVFLNLLLNARDAIVEGTGEIRIESRQDEKRVLVEISDNGVGIPAENLGAIFDPFFTTKPRGQGTGLGLSVCQKIVTAHGGTITAASNGKGSVFTLSFPLG